MEEIKLSEYDRTVIPIAKCSESDQTIIRDLGKSKEIKVYTTRDNYIIETNGAIGFIQLSTVKITIHPKFMNLSSHILQLLLIADKLPKASLAKTKLGGNLSIYEFIARYYIECVQQILRNGPKFDYLTYRETLPIVKGKISPLQSYTKSMGLFHQFSQIIEDYQADLLENQIILAGINYILKFPILQYTQKTLRSLRDQFELFTSEGILNASNLQRIVFNRSNWYYQSGIDLLRLLLDRNFISSYLVPGKYAFSWFTIDMPYIYEIFIEKLLQHIFPDRKISTQKLQVDVIEDSQNRNFQRYVKPDVLFSINDRNLVIDAKYKPLEKGVKIGDIYQLHFYGEIWGRKAVLIYPGNSVTTEYITTTPNNHVEVNIMVLTVPVTTVLDEWYFKESEILAAIRETISYFAND